MPVWPMIPPVVASPNRWVATSSSPYATPEGPRELAMDASTVTGFLSWMESAPPGG